MALKDDIKLNNSNRTAAYNLLDKTYDGAISDSDKYYQQQIDQVNKYAETQTQNQQALTDQAINVINQQKEQANKDYTREQSGAYVDWQKQSNKYGAEAEKMAAGGLNGTGFSESSQVSMYNTYQSRVATARDTYNRAVLNYDNAIKDAMLQNNVKLAEIANQALMTQLELSLAGFQYKNQLLIDKMNQRRQISSEFFDRSMQFKQLDLSRKQYNESVRQFNKTYNEDVRQFNKTYNEDVRQFNKTYNEDVRQFDKNYNLDKAQLAANGVKVPTTKKTSKKTTKKTPKKTTKKITKKTPKKTTKKITKKTPKKTTKKITKKTPKKTTSIAPQRVPKREVEYQKTKKKSTTKKTTKKSAKINKKKSK